MIIDILLYFVIGILGIITGIFSLITFALPHQVIDSFTLFFSYARLGDGIFPMSDILLALFTVVSVWILLYVVKIILFAFSAIPLVGKVINLPRHETISQASVNSKIGDDGKERVTVTKMTGSRTTRRS